jgi:hypothetical protein
MCNTDEGCAILQDIHVGICVSHAGACSLVGKMYMQEFYSPTVVSDADSLVHHCEGCQFFCSLEIHATASTKDHTNHLAFFNLWAGFGRSIKEKSKVDSRTSL